MTSSQIAMTVEQSGVPQIAVKGSTSVTKVRAMTIKMHRIGSCDGKITLKIAFIGTDASTDKKIVNKQTEKETEIFPGKDTEYTETSAPFVYNPPSVNPKNKQTASASGSKPSGWVVRVFQGGRLVKAMSSNSDLVDWIDKQ
ncbi:MAG: hypothetical protein JF599_13645 [Verrucomicrobia bacterium]|nr:hypothetical protein [Verrucomicrobiota bacterium]